MRQPPQEYITQLLERYVKSKKDRSSWDTLYQDVQDYVKPTTRDFNKGFTTGQRRTAKMFDGTAMYSATTLSSALKSYLTPDDDMWAAVGVRGTPRQKLGRAERVWAEEVDDLMAYSFSRAESNFSSASNETFSDLVAYGTAVPFIYWDNGVDGPVYDVYPLSSIWLEQNEKGRVDTVFRDMEYTIRQIRQKFGDKVVDGHEKLAKLAYDTPITITHGVYPNTDPEPERRKTGRKKFTVIYFSEQYRHVFEIGGADQIPYQVSRWSKITGDIYGISPALIAMPEILALQTMNKETLVAAQLANRPPTVFEDDGYMLPIPYRPGAQIFKTPGSPDPTQLTGGNNFNITLELLQEKREAIGKAFFIDWVMRPKKKERQTILEIQDDREEMFRNLGSILGRIEREYLAPTFINTYQLLKQNNKLPEPPASLEGRGLTIEFTSPAAQAQVGTKGNMLLRFVQDVTPLLQIDPSIAQGIKWPELVQKLGLYRGVSPEFLSTPEELQQGQQQQQNLEVASQNVALAGETASAMKDIAAAKAQGLNVLQ